MRKVSGRKSPGVFAFFQLKRKNVKHFTNCVFPSSNCNFRKGLEKGHLLSKKLVFVNLYKICFSFLERIFSLIFIKHYFELVLYRCVLACLILLRSDDILAFSEKMSLLYQSLMLCTIKAEIKAHQIPTNNK